MSDILGEYLGLDLLDLQEQDDTLKEKRKEIAVAIVKLTECPEWKVFEEELERMLKNIDKTCEFYAQNPDQAKYDSGMKRSVQVIQNFINSQKTYIENYDRRTKSDS